MKAKKLIINGEEQSLYGGLPNVCHLEITSVDGAKGTISITSGALEDGAIIQGLDTVYDRVLDTLVYDELSIPLVPRLNDVDGENFTGVYKDGNIYVRRQFSTPIPQA